MKTMHLPWKRKAILGHFTKTGLETSLKPYKFSCAPYQVSAKRTYGRLNARENLRTLHESQEPVELWNGYDKRAAFKTWI